MMGIVVNDALQELMALNLDKNYLSPLEIAAIAENHLTVMDEESIIRLFTRHGVIITQEHKPVIRLATKLANAARNMTL